MKQQLPLPCLFLPAWCSASLQDDLQVSWSDGQQAAQLPLREALATLKGRSIALIVPVEHVASCAVGLPAGSRHWQLKALPYALEPLLAEDVEGMHLVLGERLHDGQHRVVAIKRALLQAWLRYLRENGVRVSAIHVDADLLPNELASLCWNSERCLLADANGVRLALAPAQLPAVLQRLPGTCKVFHARDDKPLLPAGAKVELQMFDSAQPAWMAGQCSHALNLAQGEFATASSMRLHHWKPVAWALAAVLLAQLVFDGAQAWLLSQQAAGYRQANEAIYKGLFPQERRIVDLKAQFDQHLRQGSSATQLQSLLAAVAEAMPATAEVQLRRMHYQAGQGELQLQLQGEPPALHGLQQGLQSMPLRVKATRPDEAGLQLSVGEAQ